MGLCGRCHWVWGDAKAVYCTDSVDGVSNKVLLMNDARIIGFNDGKEVMHFREGKKRLQLIRRT